MKYHLTALGAILFLLSSCHSSTRTAYVNLTTLYDTLPLKKELNDRLQLVQKIRRDKLDSMYHHLAILDSLSKLGQDVKAEFSEQKALFETQKERFEDENDAVIKNFDKQIWAKVTDELKEYGEANHYEYIFGANGSGTLMYAAKNRDITDDVIKYVYQNTSKEDKK